MKKYLKSITAWLRPFIVVDDPQKVRINFNNTDFLRAPDRLDLRKNEEIYSYVRKHVTVDINLATKFWGWVLVAVFGWLIVKALDEGYYYHIYASSLVLGWYVLGIIKLTHIANNEYLAWLREQVFNPENLSDGVLTFEQYRNRKHEMSINRLLVGGFAVWVLVFAFLQFIS